MPGKLEVETGHWGESLLGSDRKLPILAPILASKFLIKNNTTTLMKYDLKQNGK
jgi:hypothetical protein